jgi:benzoylformate decarboxylase
MRGRNVFMQSLVAHGVEHIFGNPGTTESPLIDSLADHPQISYVVALHEGVALGAASFYAQATGKTAVVNLHVAPGLGNALGMLYGALKASSPLIVTAGQQDTRLRLRDPLLGHDLAAMAAPVTKWSVQVERADELGPILRRAFKVANDPPCGPVFVALPIDVMEQETEVPPAHPSRLFRAARPDPEGVGEATRLILAARRPAMVLGDDIARGGAAEAAVKLADRIGAAVWVEGLRHHSAFPTTHRAFRGALPFDAAGIRQALEGVDLVLLAGGPFFEEVWFAPGSAIPDGAKVVQMEAAYERLGYNFPLDAGLIGDPLASFRALQEVIAGTASSDYADAAAARLAALDGLKQTEAAAQTARAKKSWDRSPMSMARAMAEIRAGAPGDAVVVEESITANQDLARTFEFVKPGDYLSGRGGGIGQGLAGALGAKVANPDRPVLAISGDGSAMYSIQALWTAAHHDLAIVFVILANREYRVLKHNLDIYRQRFGALSNKPYAHMDLSNPDLGFVEMAQGMGVAATRVTHGEELRGAVEAAFKSGKPHLIEALIEGKR